MTEPDTIKLPVDCCPEDDEAQDLMEPWMRGLEMAEGTSDNYEGVPMSASDTSASHKGESLKWRVETTVEKFDGDYTAQEIAQRGIKPVEVVRDTGNMVMNAGIQRLLDQLIGATTSPFDATHCRLGVGNSNTAAAATQTDLSASAGSSNRQFKLVDATYPSRSSQTLTVKATFLSAEAQFNWLEWCIDRGTADGTTVTAPMFNRRVPAGGLGTKGAVSWALTVTITPTSTAP